MPNRTTVFYLEIGTNAFDTLDELLRQQPGSSLSHLSHWWTSGSLLLALKRVRA